MYELYNDNCMNITLPKCKLLLTDIPYGEVNRNDGGLRNLNKGGADIETFDLNEFLEHIYPSFDICTIFCGNEQYSTIYKYFSQKQKDGLGTVRQLIWLKSNPSPMNGEYLYLSAVENAVWFKKKGTGKLNYRCRKNCIEAPSGSSKFHPTEKNHKLLEEIILNNTNEGDLVIDTCMGGGSTGIVALSLNRDFFGVELDSEYFKISKSRIEEISAVKKPNLWG